MESEATSEDSGGGCGGPEHVACESCLGHLEKVEKLSQIIDGLFQCEVAGINHREAVGVLRKEKNEAESNYAKAVEKYIAELDDLRAKHAAEIEAMKVEHSSGLHDLESSYEGRLCSLSDKLAKKEDELRAAEESRSKEMNEKEEQHEAHINELVSITKNAERELREEVSRIKGKVATVEKTRHEMLAQQEDEYERELQQQSFAYQAKLSEKQHEIDDVNVQVQKLVAKKAWLEKQATELRSNVVDIQNERIEESERCKRLEGEIDGLQCTLKLKQELVAQLNATNEATNIEKLKLDKELYIAKTKCEELEKERGPLERTIQQQKNDATESSKLIQQIRSQKEALEQQKIVGLEQKARAKDSEIKSLRSTIRHRDRRITSLEGEFEQLAGISDEKILRNRVKVAYQKFQHKQ